MLNPRLVPAEEDGKKAWKENDARDESRNVYSDPHQHQPGARRGVKRRYRRNQDAINFLRRFTLAVVLIDLMLAISESSLISTFFLYLTLSSTFDVKPENVIETYCYYAPAGNGMCEDYMDRLTGFTSSPSASPINYYSRDGGAAGGGNLASTSTFLLNITQVPPPPPTENHFPTIPTRPQLTEEESYQLFLLFNQSFYDPSARLSLERKLDRGSELSRLYYQLVLYLAENGTVMQNRSNISKSTIFNISLPLSANSQVFNSFHQAIEVIPPAAPNLRSEIPQVSTAIRRGVASHKIRRKSQDGLGPEDSSSKSEGAKKYFILDGDRTPGFSNLHKNLIQLKDFIRHRWKRSKKNISGFPPNTATSQSSPSHGESSAVGKPPPLPAGSTVTDGKGMSVKAANATPDWIPLQQLTVRLQQGKHEATSPPAISNEKADTGEMSNNSGSGNGNDNLVNRGSGPLVGSAEKGKGTGGGPETPLINTEINKANGKQSQDNDPIPATAQPNTQSTQQHLKKVSEADRVVIREIFKAMSQRKRSGQFAGAPLMSNGKNDLEVIIAKAEANLNSFVNLMNVTANVKPKASGSKALPPRTSAAGPQLQPKQKNQRWKNFQELFAKLERSPRNLIGLVESTLFNNWKCFVQKAKQRATYTNADCGKLDSRCAGVPIPVPRPDEKRLEQLDNLVLNMEMDVFSPEVYQKGERRKRALQQIYHDHSSALMGELGDFKEMPLSHTFRTVYSTVKIYTLAWQVVICLVLFFGSVYEDKTALNIWGIFNILTSLLHFLVDEWINTTFQPEKTSAAIWFGVVYGVYKPITILLVATLSSEILKSSCGTRQKGLWANLCEIIKGRKRPPLPHTMKHLERLGEVVVVKDGEKKDGHSCRNHCRAEGRVSMRAHLCHFHAKYFVQLRHQQFLAELSAKRSSMNCAETRASGEAGKSDTENLGTQSVKDDTLVQELALLPHCGHSERSMSCEPGEVTTTDTESDEDEDQLEIVEDEDTDSDDDDIAEDADEEETDVTIVNGDSYCRESSSSSKATLAEIKQKVEKKGGVATISGPGSSMSPSSSHLSQVKDGLGHAVVDGGNVHI